MAALQTSLLWLSLYAICAVLPKVFIKERPGQLQGVYRHGLCSRKEHRIAEGKEAVSFFYRLLVRRQDMLTSRKSRYQHDEGTLR